jgi:hypothetical protein
MCIKDEFAVMQDSFLNLIDQVAELVKNCTKHFIDRAFHRFEDLKNAIEMFIDKVIHTATEDSYERITQMIEIEMSHTYMSSETEYQKVLKLLEDGQAHIDTSQNHDKQ